MPSAVDWQRYREAVMAGAAGSWPTILPVLGIGAEFLRDEGGPCPGCGGSDRYRFDDKHKGMFFCSQGGGEPAAGDGFELLKHVHGWGFTDAIDRVATVLGIARPDAQSPVAPQIDRSKRALVVPDDAGQHERARQKLRQAWRDSAPVVWDQDNAVTRYLRGRGLAEVLSDPPQDIRLLASMNYWHKGQDLGGFPVMLAVVRGPDGDAVQLHRTFLDGQGGKAKVRQAKKLMPKTSPGAMNGAAIRLYPAGDDLAVTEGIETALAIRAALSIPVWACVSDAGLRRVFIPETVRAIQVWADHDKGGAGQLAGARLVQRLRAEGRQADLFLPEQPGRDWLDVLTDKDKAG